MNISELEHQFKSLTTRGLGFTDHEIPKKERSWGAYRAVMLRLVVVVKVLLQMRARVGGGARNTARMSASTDLRRRRTPSATVVLGLGPPSGGGG